MNLRPFALIAVIAAGALALVAVGKRMQPIEVAENAVIQVPWVHLVDTPAVASVEDPVARGHYLVTLSGCNDCHTPWVMGPNGPEPDMTRMLSGHPADFEMPEAPAGDGPWVWTAAGTNTAFAGPWGVSFTANLTPDDNTGTGIWTEEMFIATIRTGRHWGQSRQLLPPMPWFNYAQMTDDDLKAVFAYLRSIPPVYNPVPQPRPPAAALDPVAAGG